MDELTVNGGCHCGAIVFTINVPRRIDAIECNCSICKKTGYLHYHIKHSDFNLLQGEDKLTEYRFNSKKAFHYFCKICGVKSFYKPRSHPNDYSINLRCVNFPEDLILNITQFNGKEWEGSINNFPEQPVGAPSHDEG